MIQETSLNAYLGEVVETLGTRQKAVLDAFTKKENFTNQELAEFLGWPINTVTPRCLELRRKGMLMLSGTRPCKSTGRMAMVFRLPEIKKTLF